LIFFKGVGVVSSLGKSNGPSATGNAEVTKLLDDPELASTSTASSGEAVPHRLPNNNLRSRGNCARGYKEGELQGSRFWQISPQTEVYT
jgi:hypothetical protein